LGNSSNSGAITVNDKRDPEGLHTMMQNVMRKILISTVFGAAATLLAHGTASALWLAPIGHRQPTAQTVPADDTVFGSGISTEHRSVAAPSAKSKVANPLDGGMDFPDICSNCNQ
jgi:hypothetical protein